MTEKEVIKILDNVFADMLIKKQCGEKYSTAVKVLIAYFKHYRSGFERELESNRENILELITTQEKLETTKKAVISQNKIINAMSEQLIRTSTI